jgi:hypothetical protein
MTKKCKDYEKLWQDRCVDQNLEAAWLERLNNLAALKLIGICEGHYKQRLSSAGRYPHINMRLNEQMLPDVARNWDDLRAEILNEVHNLFQAGDTLFNLELKYKLRSGRGRLTYQEDLTLRIRCDQVRSSVEMDPETYEWFYRSVQRIETLDQIISSWHSTQGAQPDLRA